MRSIYRCNDKYNTLTRQIKLINYLITTESLLDVCALKIPSALLLKFETGLEGDTGGPPLPLFCPRL
ncbi:hypothetical protein D3C86_2012790 [compost metagenome]